MAFNDYRRFKTPFFKIKIGDSTGKNMLDLPESISRLIEKVEILECFASDSNSSFPTVTITFIEGSREPASTKPSMGMSKLFPLDSSVASTITNRTGAIADLKFGGKTGITFLTREEVATKPKVEDNSFSKDSTFINRKAKIEAPIFLFQSGNQIQVTWGYLEDPKTIRDFRASVITLHTSFPEKGQISTTIVAQSTRVFLDKLAPTKGITFGAAKRITTKTGNSIISFEDTETSAVIEKICKDAGIKYIISPNLPASKLDKDKQKIWLAGESFDQFMTKLAATHNAYYDVRANPITGVDTLLFIKKQDFEAKLIHDDPNLYNYKYPGSIVKSVEVKVDFGPISNNTSVNVDSEGNIKSNQTSDSDKIQMFYSDHDGKNVDKLLDLDPTNNNSCLATAGIFRTILNGSFTGHLENSPTDNDKINQDAIKVKADEEARNTIALELQTLGFTQLTPGTIDLKGLGERYSGRYRILTVTHTLDSKGYNCTASATSFALPSGAIPNSDATIAKPDIPTDVKLFTPISDTQVKTDVAIRNEYGKFNQTR